MKTDNPEQGSVYRGKGETPKFRPDAHLPLLLVALLACHFLNLFMHWTVIRGELAAMPSYRTPEYTFLGFSPLHPGEIAAAQRLPNASPNGRVFAFFDWLHPAVFLVWNNGAGEEFFDLGPLLAAVPAGASRVSLLPAGILLLCQGDRVVAKNFGGSILGAVWARSLSKKNSTGNRGDGGISGSFVVKPAQGSSSLKVPFLAYFYVPLVVIVILIATYGAAMAAAFFYYAGMFFLFDFQALLVTVPLAWLLNALGVELSDPWVKVLAAALALFFLAASVYGLWSWRKREMPANSRWIVWFFILLPLFLFF